MEPDGIGFVGHGGSFWQPLTEAILVAPHYQNHGKQAQYNKKSKEIGIVQVFIQWKEHYYCKWKQNEESKLKK